MKTSQFTPSPRNFFSTLILVLSFFTLSKTYSQDKFDSKKYDVDKQDDDKIKTKVKAYRTAEVDLSSMNNILKSKHKQGEGFNFTVNIENESLEFRLFENDIMDDNSTSKKVINTYAGYVNNNSENYVRLYLSDKRLSGVYKTANGTFIITPFDDLSGGNKVKNNNKVIVYKEDDDLTTQSNISCGYYLRNPNQVQPVKSGRVAAPAVAACQVLQIVVETDYELWNIYNNEANLRAKVAEWYNLAEQIYVTNFNLRLKVTLVRIDWKNTNAPYPYAGNGTSGTLLNLFSSYWQANRTNIPRNLAMMLSGKGLTWGSGDTSYGDSFLNTECTSGGGYCMSTVWHKGLNSQLSDQNISRNICHEIGHTFGAGDLPCTSSNVTVMCPLIGKSAIFDATNKTTITNYLSSSNCTTNSYKLATTNDVGFTNDLVLKYDGGSWGTPTFINNNAHILSVSTNINNLLTSTFTSNNSNVYFWYKNNTEARFEARSTPTFTISVNADAKCFYSFWNVLFKFSSSLRVASYPNPSNEGFTIKNISADNQIDQSSSDLIKIDIFDEKGNLANSTQSKNGDFIDTKNLKNGIYFLHLNYPDQSKEIKRIIINH